MIRDGWRGRYFEDFAVGDTYQHPLGRTITDTDNVWFSLLTMNTNEIHFNDAFAQATEFKRPLVVSTLTLAIAIGQSVTDTSQNAFANLGIDEVVLRNPVFVGDTMWSESLVLSTRESSSRPHAGIVKVKTRSLNQDGAVILSFVRTFYVYKRGQGEERRSFPQADTPLTAD
jgi:itaconyl-CoA hydratase